MDRTKIILSVLLLVSAALNVRMFLLFSSSHDNFVVSMSETMQLESKTLQHLLAGKVDIAKKALTESISNKALYVGICIESGCVSDEALAKLRAKP